MKRWGTPQNFCLAFIDELQKQLFYIYQHLHIKQKNLQSPGILMCCDIPGNKFYTCVAKILMIRSTILEIKSMKNVKNTWIYYLFTNMYHK